MLNNDYLINNNKMAKRKEKKELLASLIMDVISFDTSVEFSYAKYIDGDIIAPTISEALSKNNKDATLLSPNLKTIKDDHFSTITTPYGYPFGNYGIITPTSIKSIQDVDLFIAEDNIKKALSYFKRIAALGGTCVYAMADKDINDSIKEYDRILKDLKNSNNNCITSDIYSKIDGDKANTLLILRPKNKAHK